MSLPLLPERTCGGCVECCRVIPLDLPELAKPTGELCGYCVDGAGCSVHAIRPQTCRVWFCLWRAVELSDDWRPDRSGVIVRPDGVEDGVITLYVLRRSDFLAGMDFFVTVAGWIAEGIEVALSVPGPSGPIRRAPSSPTGCARRSRTAIPKTSWPAFWPRWTGWNSITSSRTGSPPAMRWPDPSPLVGKGAQAAEDVSTLKSFSPCGRRWPVRAG